MNSSILYLALTSIIFLYLQSLDHSVLGLSPSFTLEEISDAPHDWFDSNYNEVSGYNHSNIQAIIYSSNGKILNATLWLCSKFEERPIGYTPAYAMLVDIDSDLYTGNGGFEYDAGIYWNNNTKTWSYYVQERSIAGHIRILNQTLIGNYTRFFDRNQTH
jgi:hypothetical protein